MHSNTARFQNVYTIQRCHKIPLISIFTPRLQCTNLNYLKFVSFIVVLCLNHSFSFHPYICWWLLHLKNLKNQIMTTNLWVEQVRSSIINIVFMSFMCSWLNQIKSDCTYFLNRRQINLCSDVRIIFDKNIWIWLCAHLVGIDYLFVFFSQPKFWIIFMQSARSDTLWVNLLHS